MVSYTHSPGTASGRERADFPSEQSDASSHYVGQSPTYGVPHHSLAIHFSGGGMGKKWKLSPNTFQRDGQGWWAEVGMWREGSIFSQVSQFIFSVNTK